MQQTIESASSNCCCVLQKHVTNNFIYFYTTKFCYTSILGYVCVMLPFSLPDKLCLNWVVTSGH